MFQKIMRNKNLSPEAKAIYAYLCSFAGSGKTCHPSVDTMLQELGMSKGRLSKYMKELIACGVVERTRSINKNLLSGNVYRITHNVEVDFAENANCDFSSVGNCDFNDIRAVENCDFNDIRAVENHTPNINSINNNNINTSVQNPEDETGFSITLKDDSIYKVSAENLAMWKRAYPALDVEGELCRMEAWCNANPTKRKTSKGVEKFINGWLNRSLVDSGSGQSYQNTYRGGVNNYEQHEQPEPYNPEDDPDHVPSVNEVWERLQREGLV